MEKEMIKNRQATELALIKAVDDIIEESGFEGLGINAVAAKAGVAKMLIYRYFNSLDGLIAAYAKRDGCRSFHCNGSHQLSGITRRELSGLQRTQNTGRKRLGTTGNRN